MPRRSPTEPAPPPSAVHRIATAGNATIVAFLALLLAQDRAFNGSPPPPAFGSDSTPARRLLLVVIDGLRADAAADAALMPHLARLRAAGAGGEVRVGSLIPSTIAGVVALATGAASPPAAVFQDFRALPADDGGLLAAVKAGGGGTFVAGPPVWGDLYGRWIDERHGLSHLVDSDDAPLVDAAVAAMRSDRHRLLVVHLGAPDDVAHRSGTKSSAYAAAARAADAALGRLTAHAAADDIVVVTSDHGNTAAGGHAGPEDDVVRIPLVVAGPGVADSLPVRRQTEIPAWAARALRAPAGDVAVPRPPADLTVPPRVAAVLVCAAAACALWVCGGVVSGSGGRFQPTVLNSAVWVAIALAALGYRGAALGAAVVALAGAAVTTAGRRGAAAVTVVAAAGACFAGLRLLDGTGPTWTAGPARTAAWALGTAAAVLAGRMIGRWLGHGGSRAAVAGAAAVAAVALCGRVAGQTVSLSTLDVRAAYGLAAHPATVPLAVAVAAAVHAAPAVGVVAGLAGAVRRAPAGAAATFAGAAGAAFVGQLAAAALALALAPAEPLRWAALGLNLLLRSAAEATYLFGGLAIAAVICGRRRRGAPPG